MLAGYDYVVLGLVLVSVLVVVQWGKWWLTHIILGSYLLILLALGLYRCIDVWIGLLMVHPSNVGLFSVSNQWLAVFLSKGELRIVSAITLLVGSQVVYGSSLGSLTNRSIIYRVWRALHMPLAVIGVWLVFMVLWAGGSFFDAGLSVWTAKMFSDPIVRQTINWLPAVLTGHLLLTILATTTFFRFINVSFGVNTPMKSRDSIYVEQREPPRTVVE